MRSSSPCRADLPSRVGSNCDDTQSTWSDRGAGFYDRCLAAHRTLDLLKADFRTMRALSARLSVLHPNDLSTPTLALDLRDTLLAAAQSLRYADQQVYCLWSEEEGVRLACEQGRDQPMRGDRTAGGSQAGEMAERQEEVQAVVRRFCRRVRDVKREAKGEARDRKRRIRRDGGQEKEPDRVADYLEPGVYEFPHLLTKDSVHASRWVVENPFSLLVRLTDNLTALNVPQMVKTGMTPSSFVGPPMPPPLYPIAAVASTHDPFDDSKRLPDNPTPAGTSVSHRRMPDWKQSILDEAAQAKARGKVSWSHRLFDKVALGLNAGVTIDTGRGRRQRWILLMVTVLFPVILFASLVEKLSNSDREGWSSSSSMSSSGGVRLSLHSLPPTMMSVDDTQAEATGASSATSEERKLKERRRSADVDAALV